MKNLLLILAFAAVTCTAQAQEKERRSAQERAQLQTGRMTKDLGLTTMQASQVETINLKYAEQADALRAERQAAKEKAPKEGKGKALAEAKDAELKAVLTPEQYATWQVKKEAMMAKQKAKREQKRAAEEAE